MLNKELLLELCKKYDVEFTSNSNKAQIIIDGVQQDITPEIINQILTNQS